jgi:hypothetical protein
VSVYVVVVVGETVIAVPDVAGRLPGVITPVPLLKTGVKVVIVPAVMTAAPAVREVAIGPGTEPPPPPLVSPPPPPPPPPHAIPRIKTRPRKSERLYWRSDKGNLKIMKPQVDSLMNKKYSKVNIKRPREVNPEEFL